MNALEIAALGLRTDVRQLTVTGHNMANVSTPGYKRQVLVQPAFAGTFDAAAAAAARVETDLRAAKVSTTGRALDLALPEGSFLVVEREDGTQALTRQGSLQTDAAGILRTPAGHTVLGNGGAVTVRDPHTLSVDVAGRLLADSQPFDTLRTVSLQPGAHAAPIGDGLFDADPAQWQPGALRTGLRSGALETSNVVSSQEMVTLMTTTRHAETMVRLIQTADEMLDKAIRRFGDTA